MVDSRPVEILRVEIRMLLPDDSMPARVLITEAKKADVEVAET